MNYLKTNPQGIDKAIQRAQVLLYDALNTLWGIELDGYGRVYKNEKSDKVVPEVYKSENDYSGTLFTTEKAKFFFETSDKSDFSHDTYFKSLIGVYFIVNLDTINIASHRADEEIRQNVFAVLRESPFREMKSIEVGIKNVASNFTNILEGNTKWADKHPYHVFKIVSEVEYYYDQNC